jgi:hypothetical protein
MRQLASVVAVALAPALITACGGAEKLSPAEKAAYDQIMAYETRADEILVRGQPYQQAAARQLRENVRVLKGADLDEDADAALDTIAATPHEVENPDRPADPRRARKVKEAVATLREAVAGRLE